MARSNLNIIIENKIPFIQGILDEVANVQYLPNEQITPEAVKDVDALIVRTRTHCNAELLEGSRCSFIATATIGMDHIDLDYCRAHGITAVNAPGCNAPAVAQYVMASLAQVINRPIDQYTIGIVGVGHVGSIVANWARSLDMKVLLCDPPRARREGGEGFVTLEEIAAKADIITFHTPLTRSGEDATYHLADEKFFQSLRFAPIIINSSRGEVVDNRALVKALDDGMVLKAVVDTWENEPKLLPELLQRASISTPHIAGYSREGKIRASVAAVEAICSHFNLSGIGFTYQVPKSAPGSVKWASVVRSYNPMEDTLVLKSHPEQFERLRNEYDYRQEVGAGKND
jgi:erythronate-4-phosphate dehydrogenase